MSPPPCSELLLIYGYVEHIHALLFLKPAFIFDVAEGRPVLEQLLNIGALAD